MAEATYQALEEQRQGRRDFYRRELPRLAEVEAHGWGDNLSINLIENGGSYVLTTDGTNTLLAFDGDASTGFSHQIRNPEKPHCQRTDHRYGGHCALGSDPLSGQQPGLHHALLHGRARRSGQSQVGSASARRNAERNIFTGHFLDIADIQNPPVLTRFLDMVTIGHVPPGFRATGPGGTGHMNQFWSYHHELMLLAEGSSPRWYWSRS